MKPSVILACAAALFVSTAAGAAPITYAWTGTVESVDPNGFGIAVGEPISITLTLDGDAADLDPNPNRGLYASDPGDPPVVLAVNIGGVTQAGIFQEVEVLDNVGGVDMFKVVTQQQLVDIGFTFTFQTTDTGVLSGDGIPASVDPADFTTATFSVFQVHGLGTIDALAAPAVPEPGTLTLLGAALLGLAMLGRSAARRAPRSRPGPSPEPA